jgi:hypothetical protein
VWREAFNGDVVCVPPAIRDLVREENRVGPGLRISVPVPNREPIIR